MCLKIKNFLFGISIHSLPKEGDPLRFIRGGFFMVISIHSLPKEGDRLHSPFGHMEADFNPLPPQGGRLSVLSILTARIKFQSTPSPRRETKRDDDLFKLAVISIHSLPKEGDDRFYLLEHKYKQFQSTPSPRRETFYYHYSPPPCIFQSTPSPRRETL